MQEMVDADAIPNPAKQLTATYDNLRYGRPVTQGDIKQAVVHNNLLRKQYSHRADGSAELAFALGNYNFWKWREDEQLSLVPDQELANELTELQKHALIALRAQRSLIPKTDCLGFDRDEAWVEIDTNFADHQLLVVGPYLGELIKQASPQEESPTV